MRHYHVRDDTAGHMPVDPDCTLIDHDPLYALEELADRLQAWASFAVDEADRTRAAELADAYRAENHYGSPATTQLTQQGGCRERIGTRLFEAYPCDDTNCLEDDEDPDD